MKKLPKKLSSLAKIAIGDLVKAERSSRYQIVMDTWHSPAIGRCSVCLAGSVIAFSLDKQPDRRYLPEDTDFPNQLYALDKLRKGHVADALENMGRLTLNNLDDAYELSRTMPTYEDNPGKFKRAFRKLIKDMEAVGL